MLRFWGSLDTAISLWDNPHRGHNSLQATLADIQGALMMMYYALEHYAWTGFVAPELVRPERANRASRLSCIAWLAWIVVELFKLHRRLQELHTAKQSIEQKAREPNLDQQVFHARLTTVKQAGDLLLALHWSAPEFFPLSERAIALLGVSGAVLSGIVHWQNTSA